MDTVEWKVAHSKQRLDERETETLVPFLIICVTEGGLLRRTFAWASHSLGRRGGTRRARYERGRPETKTPSAKALWVQIAILSCAALCSASSSTRTMKLNTHAAAIWQQPWGRYCVMCFGVPLSGGPITPCRVRGAANFWIKSTNDDGMQLPPKLWRTPLYPRFCMWHKDVTVSVVVGTQPYCSCRKSHTLCGYKEKTQRYVRSTAYSEKQQRRRQRLVKAIYRSRCPTSTSVCRLVLFSLFF